MNDKLNDLKNGLSEKIMMALTGYGVACALNETNQDAIMVMIKDGDTHKGGMAGTPEAIGRMIREFISLDDVKGKKIEEVPMFILAEVMRYITYNEKNKEKAVRYYKKIYGDTLKIDDLIKTALSSAPDQEEEKKQ